MRFYHKFDILSTQADIIQRINQLEEGAARMAEGHDSVATSPEKTLDPETIPQGVRVVVTGHLEAGEIKGTFVSSNFNGQFVVLRGPGEFFFCDHPQCSIYLDRAAS